MGGEEVTCFVQSILTFLPMILLLFPPFPLFLGLFLELFFKETLFSISHMDIFKEIQTRKI